MLMEEDNFGDFDDSEESKRDFSSDLLHSGGRMSSGPRNSESRKQALLQQRQQALQRQSSRRRQSSGAIESNKGFVKASTPRTLGQKRNSVRFSIPKSIDPLQGEHGPSLAFKSKDYAKSYKGGYQPKEYGTVLSSEEEYHVPVKSFQKSDLVMEEQDQPMYDVEEESVRDEREDDTGSNVSDTNSNQSSRSNQSSQHKPVHKAGWQKDNEDESYHVQETKDEGPSVDRSYFSESKQDRKSRSEKKASRDTVETSRAKLKADMKKRGIAQSYDPNHSPLPTKAEARKESGPSKNKKRSSKPKLPKKPFPTETSEEEKRITDEEFQEEQKQSAGSEEEDNPVSRRRSRQNNLRSRSKSGEEVEIDLSNMYDFLVNACPKQYGSVQCYIERHKGNLKLSPEYFLYLKQGDRFLMGSKKRAGKATANYIITMDQKQFSKTSPSYLGKLRSNFLGTEFQIFDKGVNPKNNDPDALHAKNSTVREELGCVIYASNVLGSRGPRKMKVAVPALNRDGTRVVCRPTKKADELLSRFKDRDMKNVIELINKPPRWNDQVGAYVLNFNGRVTMASVKNFQLVSPDDEDKIILQFGRVGKDLFTMDFAHPLTPFQAFSICLSSLDGKWACE